MDTLFFSKYTPVFLLTFVNGLSFTMLFPVLPFIVRSYEQPEIFLGILFSVFSFFQLLSAPVLGSLSDKYGRKNILTITHFGTMLAWILLGISYFLPNIAIASFLSLPILVILISRIFDGLTGGNNSVAQAIIADLTTREERTKIFGFNGAIIGFALIVGPAIGAFSLSFGYSYLGTALIGFIISFIVLLIIIFLLPESLPEEKRKNDIVISFKEINAISQVWKWKNIPQVRYVMIMKVCMFISFVGYTSVITLYLIDRFGFDPEYVGYYMAFTGIFLIFHQAYSVRIISETLRDRKSLLLGLMLMTLGFMAMGLSINIYLFTLSYFFAIMGIAVSWSTLSSLFSRSVDERTQGEIMGLSSSIESSVSVVVPIIITFLYASVNISIYFLIALLPFIGFCISRIFYKNIEFRNAS